MFPDGALFKVLDPGRKARYGSGSWSEPGVWMPEVSDPVLCERGYHMCRRQDLVRWLGPEIWVAERRGALIEGDDKVVASEARLVSRVDRWDDRTARLFAADCAEWVLPLFERDHPDDVRPREAIEVARRFAAGDATGVELTAAGDAAWAAAWDAAWAAVRGAAGAAAGDAAWDAVGDWQTDRLFQYLELDEVPPMSGNVLEVLS